MKKDVADGRAAIEQELGSPRARVCIRRDVLIGLSAPDHTCLLHRPLGRGSAQIRSDPKTAGGAMRFINMHDGTGDEHCVFQNQVIASAGEKTSFTNFVDPSSGLVSVPRSLGGFCLCN